jgi:site-specific recombinase XerC
LARDTAVLALLYGSGLRISEALSLRRTDLSSAGDVAVVTGKGGKTRMVPLLPQVLDLINTYTSLCPYDLPADQPLFVGAKGGPLSPRIVQIAPRHMHCGIPSRRISSRVEETCAQSRNCLATPRSRPHRFIPESIPSDCLTPIAARIRGPD